MCLPLFYSKQIFVETVGTPQSHNMGNALCDRWLMRKVGTNVPSALRALVRARASASANAWVCLRLYGVCVCV